MHELALSQAILDTALRHADGRRVSAIALRVGSLRQVVPESVEFYLELVAQETVCEGARIELELVAARLRCTPCGEEWELERPPFRCPWCGGSDVVTVAGNELEVESITVEEEACIARR